MSKLEQLIKEKCPNGAEYIKLNNLIEKAPKSPYGVGTLSQLNKGDIIAFTSGNKTFTVNKYLVDGEYIFMNDGGQADTKYYKGKANYSDHVFAFTSNSINIRFLYHYLLKINETINKDYFRGGGIKNLVKKDFLEIEVPVPPLEVQREIVEILDNFTLLSAELSAELSARKEQFESYKELLIYNSTNNKTKLSDIATSIYRGSGIKRDEVFEKGIPCVRYGEIYTTYDLIFNTCRSHTNENIVSNPKYFEHGDILFAITGESVEDIAKSIAYTGNEKCLAGGDIVVLKHNQEPRYMSYALSTKDAISQKAKGKVKSKVVHSSVPSISNIEIPLPNLEEQKRIADILDSFHELIVNISSGLPAEIEARQKQYEYYRDKLLSFKRLEV